MRAFVVGTAGHVDHGKTALVRALTGVETDRWREERERGLTIDLGFAPLPLADGSEASVVDVPGHEDFVKNMLAGATGIDLLLLVVAADEGPMPQTREHLAIADLLGVREGVVAITKTDRVEQDWLELCRSAVRDELGTVLGHADWPVCEVSAIEGTGVEELREMIARRAAALEMLDGADLFRLPVDRSFSAPGAGTVVTGTTWSGAVSAGDGVTVLPVDRTARVRALQVHSTARERVGPGHRCAVALVGVDAHEVPRGSVVVSGAGWRLSRRLGVSLRSLSFRRRPLEHGQRVRVYLGTREVMARLSLPRGSRGPEPLPSGGEAWAVLHLEEGLVARGGDRFVLRFYSPVTTIGGGTVVELDPPPEWSARTGFWSRLLGPDRAERVVAAVALAGGDGLPHAELPIATGLSGTALRTTLAETGSRIVKIGEAWFSLDAVRDARERALGTLERMHGSRRRAAWASREALRSQVAREFDASLVDMALRELEAEGEIEVDGPDVRRAGHSPSLTGPEAEARRVLADTIDRGGLEPPTTRELERSFGLGAETMHDLLRLLVRQGEVEAISPEIYLSVRNVDLLRERARGAFEDRELVAPAVFKEKLGVTRKYLIPQLEYLDRIGLTRRTREGRVWLGTGETTSG